MYISTHYRPRGGNAREIATNVEADLRRGRIFPGDPLPPVRSLAEDLGLSPATVASAYKELRRRGIAAGAGRAGTRIRQQTPLATRIPLVAPPGVRDLLSGGPDPRLLPPPRKSKPAPSRLYGEPAVLPRLRSIASEQLTAEGIDATHLAVMGGALDGVERVLSAWLRVGDKVAVEDPGYSAVLDLLAAMGFEVLPVGLDDYGLRPDALDAALDAGAQALVATPRAQNPTGAAWDSHRASQLAGVLRLHPGIVVVEDDHAGPVAGTPAFTTAGSTDHWATVRSVSKWLGPDLRVAILAGDEGTVSRVEGRQALGAGWVSWQLQQAVADLWGNAPTRALLNRATAIYARRREGLHRALQRRSIESHGRSGLTAWIPVADEQGVTARLVAGGWAVASGQRFRIASPPGIRVAVSTLQPPEADELAGALDAILKTRSVRDD